MIHARPIFACLLVAVLAGLVPRVEIASAAGARDARQIAYLGDSRVAAQFDDPSQRVQSARFFGNVAAQRLDQGLETAVNLAVSGQRSDQYLSDDNVARATASPALWALVFGVVNDIGQRGAQDYFGGYPAGLPGGVRAQVEKLRAAGMRPILVLEPGAAAFSADPTRLQSVATYNAAVRAYAAEHGDVVLFDLPAATTDAGSPLLFRPGFARDGLHLDNLGGIAAGEAFAALMRPLLPRAPAPATEGGLDLMPNGGFRPDETGAPQGYTLRCDPGLEASLSPAATAGDVRMSVRASAPGTCSLGMDLAGEEPEQRYRESVRAEVEAGATGLTGPYLQLQVRRAGASVDAFDNFWGTGGVGPGEARNLVLRTPPLTIPQGAREWFTTRLGLHFSGPGGATVVFRDHHVAPL